MLVANAYQKLWIAAGGEDMDTIARLFLATIKQALHEACMYSIPPYYAAPARRFLVCNGFALIMLDLQIDCDYGNKVILKLFDDLRNDAKMAKLDKMLQELTKRKRTHRAADALCAKAAANG